MEITDLAWLLAGAFVVIVFMISELGRALDRQAERQRQALAAHAAHLSRQNADLHAKLCRLENRLDERSGRYLAASPPSGSGACRSASVN